MFLKKIVLVVFIVFFSNIIAQTRNNEWQVGVSAGVTKFNDEDVSSVGDKHQFQIPRLNVVKPIGNNLALDAAISFTTFDVGIITNEATYFSFDTSLRYFFSIGNSFYPYAFAGASITDVGIKVAPSLNVGVGGTFWINDVFGLNAQAYYKNSLNADNVPSHLQITGGMVFALDLYDLFYGIISGCTNNY